MAKNQLDEAIRKAFDRCDLSINSLAERSGVSYASAHGFLVGDRDIALSTAARLCKTLVLELRPRREKSDKGRRVGRQR